jgi:phosphatidylglycerol:prolipoprotein diacylglycerol transferase
MLPYLNIDGFELPLFAVCIAIGVNLGSYLIARSAEPPERFGILIRWICFLAIFALGGRVGYELLFDARHLRWTLAGSSTILGSIFFGIIFIALTSRVRRADWREEGDRFILPLLILQGCGKLGCFLAGCCYGRQADLPWSIVPSCNSASWPIGVPLHPVQLYELGLYGLLAIALVIANRRRRLPGKAVGIYLLGYGAIRAAAELVRGDAVPWFYGITIGQAAALPLAILGCVILARSRGEQVEVRIGPSAGIDAA